LYVINELKKFVQQNTSNLRKAHVTRDSSDPATSVISVGPTAIKY